MWFLWLIIGLAIGFAAAWFYLQKKYAAEVTERDRAITRIKMKLEDTDANRKTDEGARKLPQLDSAKQKAEAQSDRAAVETADRSVAALASKAAELDDLTRIKGIGPAITTKLADIGITTFQQIADFTAADIEHVNEKLAFKGRVEREKWVEQAKDLAKES
jgi:predicted flap endonuclease-1-like 5' DNA nuclease